MCSPPSSIIPTCLPARRIACPLPPRSTRRAAAATLSPLSYLPGALNRSVLVFLFAFRLRVAHQRFWSTLKGWRNESYCVPSTSAFSSTPLFWLERAAVPIFGTLGLGVHINGYVRDPTSGDIKLWIARRSATKQTWPGFLDNFVAGGQPLGIGLMDNVVKECAEEAGVPEAIARKAVSTGAVSYYIELERGLTPETQYVFDLELSAVRFCAFQTFFALFMCLFAHLTPFLGLCSGSCGWRSRRILPLDSERGTPFCRHFHTLTLSLSLTLLPVARRWIASPPASSSPTARSS